VHEGHPVVCVTPAGRRRYMKLLASLVLSSPLVDRWDLWVNTSDKADLAFLQGLARMDGRVRLVPQPDGAEPSVGALCAFSRLAMDPGTIYIRLDDDLVWADAAFPERLLAFRVAQREHFLVMPLILNNAICSHLLQSLGKLRYSRHVTSSCTDGAAWRDPHSALVLHRFLLPRLARGEQARLASGPIPIALNRFSINCVCWFGEDMALAGGVKGPDEEEELSAEIPTRLRRTCCFQTDVAVAHFAFYTQREATDASEVLAGYAALLARRPELVPWLERAERLARECDPIEGGTPWGMAAPGTPLRRRLRAAWRRLVGRERAPVTVEEGPCY
jgi:hypothetical protein